METGKATSKPRKIKAKEEIQKQAHRYPGTPEWFGIGSTSYL